MKTNNYLSLCHEQAALSSLHYRHGCVIVRGGKVVGIGHNDHRKGFDGGALKTGRIASSSLDGPAIADLKRKRKLKQKPDISPNFDDAAAVKPFVPYERMSGGHHANVPLSMHSEMMAIHSALARSSTLAVTAVSSVKPSFKLPGSSKRKAKLRNDALKAYVELVCCAAFEQQQGVKQSSTERLEGKSSVQEWRFEAPASQPGQVGGGKQQQGGRGQGAQVRQYRETPNEKRQQPSPDESERVSVSFSSNQDASTLTTATKMLRPDGSISCEYSLPERSQDNRNTPQATLSAARHKRAPDKNKPTKAELMFIPNGRNEKHTISVTDRMRHSLLSGADLYVARFSNGSVRKHKQRTIHSEDVVGNPDDDNDGASLSRSSSLTDGSSASMQSLHDELRAPDPRPDNRTRTSDDPFDWNTVHASRPCYRCVAYMHSVGIKRVFWTNDNGQWEGAKVRDLIDALDMSSNTSEKGGRKLIESGVFITKHEVLMMRRMMGGN